MSHSSTWWLPGGIVEPRVEAHGEDGSVRPSDLELRPVLVFSLHEHGAGPDHQWLPWVTDEHSGEIVAHPDVENISEFTLRCHALVRLFASGKIVLAEPDGLDRSERRRVERAGFGLWVIRPTRQGDILDGFVPGVMRDRQHYTSDGMPKQNLSVDRAAEIVAENSTMQSYDCSVCGNLHIVHRQAG